MGIQTQFADPPQQKKQEKEKINPSTVQVPELKK
jgi:hypothetical protein